MLQGIKNSGVPKHIFRHNDPEHLEELLAKVRWCGGVVGWGVVWFGWFGAVVWCGVVWCGEVWWL